MMTPDERERIVEQLDAQRRAGPQPTRHDLEQFVAALRRSRWIRESDDHRDRD